MDLFLLDFMKRVKKPTLCCCFTWTVFIELNFILAFLLIRKTWDDGFVGKVGGWGILRNGGILVMVGMILKWGVNTPLRTMKLIYYKLYKYNDKCETNHIHIKLYIHM